jgi:phage terminase small subunit
MADKLNPQQMHFCVLYAKGNQSATACAEQAGYKKNSAGSMANKLLKLPKIGEMCSRLQEAHLARLGITEDTIFQSMLELANESRQAGAWSASIQAVSKLAQWKNMENKLTTSVKLDVAFEDLLQKTVDITPANVLLPEGTETAPDNPDDPAGKKNPA